MGTTEERVRAAAVRLFAERGFHGTGIRDLAEAAGLSSASLYHYMGTKEELLSEVMCRSLERLLDRGRTAVASADTPLEQLAALVAFHVREHAEQRLETTVVDGELRALRSEARDRVLGLRDDYEVLWQRVIDAGARDGTMQVGDTRLARMALLDMCTGVSRWYSPGGRLGLEDVSQRYVALALSLVSG